MIVAIPLNMWEVLLHLMIILSPFSFRNEMIFLAFSLVSEAGGVKSAPVTPT